jgi:hypothetical protein
MSILDQFAHGLLGVIGLFAGLVLAGLTMIDGALRYLLSDVGLGSEVQTCAVIFIQVTILLGVLRLLRGRIRLLLAMILMLLLAYTLGRIARMP